MTDDIEGQFELFAPGDLGLDDARVSNNDVVVASEPAHSDVSDPTVASGPAPLHVEPDNEADENSGGHHDVADDAGNERGSDEPDVAPPAPVWETLQAGTFADGHALIVNAGGSYTPSGTRRTGPVDSTDKLLKLIEFVALTPLGVPAQIWLVGVDACEALGWSIDPGSEDDVDDLETLRVRAAETLTAAITATLAPVIAAGWELTGEPGFVVRLFRRIGKATQMVHLILEPYVWTYWNKDFGWGNRVGDMGVLGNPAAGTYLPDDEMAASRELGRRLSWCAEHLGTLPGPTPARTGAAVLDKIRRERSKTGKGVMVTESGPVPPLNGPPRGDLEPAAGWARLLDDEDTTGATRLVTLDQRAAYLASAGMLSFGYGTPDHVHGVDAVDAAVGDKAPFGLWRVTLPAAAQFSLPDKLPLPHPLMEHDRPVQTWVTTVSLDGLRAPVADGGMGLDIDDLGITEAWVYPEQGRALDKWASVLRAARTVADETGDAAMKRFLGACYKGYIGRMVNPDMWSAARMQHHHQPLWRAAIIAHCRWRGRRVAMRIARDTGRWPIRTATDSWVYLLGAGENVADDSPALGKMVIEKTTNLTPVQLSAIATAADPHQLRLALAAAYGGDDPDEEVG